MLHHEESSQGVLPHGPTQAHATHRHIHGVQDVTDVRARWLGHRLHADLNIAVDAALSVQEGHEVAREMRHRLLHHVRYLANATVHVDPVHASGEMYHRIAEHTHDDLPPHGH